ncbi:MAG: hypothetical protein KKF41_14775 [Actinobacteria bacterium]|nr:hypothetical protein [Actinomycetota bacterium]MBU1944381.1 hypothetical protein [Actinomycetota bacterium]MBU2688840.1 hypothetical protein [Actinomycetota bacterium]
MEPMAGDRCRIRYDIPAPQGPAFRAGEEVYIMKVDPHPANLEYRYVVRSAVLQEFFMLRAADLEPLSMSRHADVPVRQVRRFGSPRDNVPGVILLVAGIGMLVSGPLPWYKVFGVNHSGTWPIMLSMVLGVFVTFRALEVLYVLPQNTERRWSRPVALGLSIVAVGVALYALTAGVPDMHTRGPAPYLFMACSLAALAASAVLMVNTRAPASARAGA